MSKIFNTGRKKLAIVAFAPSSNMLAPYNNDEYDIWILNHYYAVMDISSITNITALFEPHTREIIENKEKYNGIDHMGWLQQCTQFPIVMMKDIDKQNFADIPNSIAYPWEEITQHFKLNSRPDCKPFTYMTNTVSFMLAYAIYCKSQLMNNYETIELFGVDMAQASEYAYERPSCEYFIGVAWGRGIEIYLPEVSDLLRTEVVYGREELIGANRKMKETKRIGELKNRIDVLKSQEIVAIEDYYQKREKDLTDTILAYHTKSLTIATQKAKLEGALESTAYSVEVY